MNEEIVPIFRVKDGYKTAQWYARLGFEVAGEHRFAPHMPLYLFLQWGDIHLHLSEHKGMRRWGQLSIFMYIISTSLPLSLVCKFISNPGRVKSSSLIRMAMCYELAKGNKVDHRQ